MQLLLLSCVPEDGEECESVHRREGGVVGAGRRGLQSPLNEAVGEHSGGPQDKGSVME